MRNRSSWVAAAVAMLSAWAWAQAPKQRANVDQDNYRARAAWFLRFRHSHDGLAPAADHLRAWRHALGMPAVRPRSLSAASGSAAPVTLGTDWTELGPQPEIDSQYGDIAGRLASIAVASVQDPTGNTVYVGAADGGIWKSTNALAAQPVFTAIGDNLPSLAIGAIALDASTTPATIYVGTGEGNASADSYYGIGVLKSTDGGATWSSGTGVNFLGSGITRLLIDPNNPEILLAAVTESGVYVNDDNVVSAPAIGIVRSSDGGATWTQVYSGASATDLVYMPTSATAGTYYAAIRGQGIFRSTDQGQSWVAVGNPLGNASIGPVNFYRASLAQRGGQLFVLISDGQGGADSPADCGGVSTCTGLATSLDGGVTWTALNLPDGLYGPNHQGTYDQYIAAPPGSSALLVGGIDLWSAPLAANLVWTNLTNSYGTGTVHPDEHGIVCLDAARWFIANDGGVWYTANAGASWSDLNASLNTIQFYSVSADPATAGRYLGGSQDNGTALAAGSPSWNEIWGGDGGTTAINAANPQQLFTENTGISLHRSDDGGHSFQTVVDATTITDAPDFYTPYALTPDKAAVYLVTNRVWRGPAVPTAPGQGWQPISGNLTHPSGAQTDDTLTAIAVAPSDPNTVYVGAYDGSLSVSHNAASASPTWTRVGGIGYGVGAPVTAIAVSPTDPNTVYWGYSYVGGSTSNLIDKSSDGGVTPIEIAGNLPAAPVNAIVVDPAHPSNLYVATDVGVFVAGDGGTPLEQWARLGDNLPAAAVLSLALTSAGGIETLIAGTHGRGAWSIPAVAPAGFLIRASPALQTIEAGQTATYALTTTATNGPSTITLACNNWENQWPCAVSPASLAAGGNATLSSNPSNGGGDGGTNFPNIAVTASDGTSTQIVTVQIHIYDFSLYWSPGNSAAQNTAIQLGQSSSFPIKVVDNGYGSFDAPVTLSCPNAPAGITCSFSNATVTGVNGITNDSVQVAVAPNAAVGTVALDIRGIGGTVTRDLTLDLKVTQFQLAATPATVTTAAGTPQTFSVGASSTSAFSGPIALSCAVTGNSPGQCAVAPASIAVGGSATVTVTGLLGGASDVVTVTGAGGGTSVTAQASVQAANFFLQASSAPTLPGSNTALVSLSALSGFSDFHPAVTLACATPGLSCAFNPATITPGVSSTVTVSGLAALPESNNIPLVINGTSGGLTNTVTATLANDAGFVLAGPPYPPPPVLPGDSETFDVSVSPVAGYLGGYSVTCGGGLSFPCAPAAATAAGGTGAGAVPIVVAALPGPGPVNVPVMVSTSQGGVTLSHSVTVPLLLGDFTITVQNPSATVAPGGVAVYAVDFHATPNLSAKVNLTCSGLPAGTSCQAQNSIPLFDGGSTGVGVLTSAAHAPAGPRGAAASPGPGPWTAGGLVLLLGIGLAAGRKRRVWVLAGFLACASVACGGGAISGNGGGTNGGGSAAPPLTTSFTITATDASPGAVNPVSRSVTVQLTIQ